MKKFLHFVPLVLLLVVNLAFFSSCSKDDDDDVTYQIHTTNFGCSGSVNMDLIIGNYNSAGERIGSQSWDRVPEYSNKKFNAVPGTTKLKIYYKMYTSVSSKSGWIQQVFYLNSGKTIELTGETIVGGKEP